MVDEAALERELFEVGRRLAGSLPSTRNPLKALDDKAMDLASSDQELKAALFRFVDVVPACRNMDDLARHDLLLLVHRGDDAEQAELALHSASVPAVSSPHGR